MEGEVPEIIREGKIQDPPPAFAFPNTDQGKPPSREGQGQGLGGHRQDGLRVR